MTIEWAPDRDEVIARAQRLARLIAPPRLIARLESGAGQDWLRHALGYACTQPVLAHRFLSGTEIGFAPGRCVRLETEEDPWCTAPRRCHLTPEEAA